MEMGVDLWTIGNVGATISNVANFHFSMPMWNGEALGVGWRLELVQKVWKVLNFLNILNFLNSYLFPRTRTSHSNLYNLHLYLVIVTMCKISKGKGKNFLIWTKKYG